MNERQEIAEEVNRRANLLTRLGDSVERILNELGLIREELQDRPTRIESVQRRRGSIVLLLGVIVMSSYVVDSHIENCGPGYRSDPVIDAFVEQVRRGVPSDREELMEVASRPVAAHCDIFIPVHTHNPGHWPSPGNVLGIAIILLFFVMLFVWHRWPSRWNEDKQGTNAVTHAWSRKDRPIRGSTPEIKIEADTVVVQSPLTETDPRERQK